MRRTIFVRLTEEQGLSRLNNNCQFGYKHSFRSNTNWNNKSPVHVISKAQEQQKEATFSPISVKLQRKKSKNCEEVNIAANILRKTTSCKSRVNIMIDRCKKALHENAGLKNMARSRGFEPLTAWFVARYSIQLSY
ncbi:hypothetical protein FXE87_03685, partial [Vibrio mimicus]